MKSPSNTVIYTVLASLRLYDQELCRGIALSYQTYGIKSQAKTKTPPLRAEQFEYLNLHTKLYVVLYNMRNIQIFNIYYRNTPGTL